MKGAGILLSWWITYPGVVLHPWTVYLLWGVGMTALFAHATWIDAHRERSLPFWFSLGVWTWVWTSPLPPLPAFPPGLLGVPV